MENKDFICWLIQTPDSSRVTTRASSRKEALTKFAEHLGCRISSYMQCRAAKQGELLGLPRFN